MGCVLSLRNTSVSAHQTENIGQTTRLTRCPLEGNESTILRSDSLLPFEGDPEMHARKHGFDRSRCIVMHR